MRLTSVRHPPLTPGTRYPLPSLKRSGSSSGQSPELFGRDEDISSILQRLDRDPLVTLVGPPGVGKTTLGHAVGRRAAAQGTQVLLVDLAGASTEAEVSSRFAFALARHAKGAFAALEAKDAFGVPQWASALATADSMLLVVDECEGATAAAAAACELAIENEGVRVLATSREPLDVEAEAVLAIEPLGVPDPSADPSEASLAPSVSLLLRQVERATGKALAVRELATIAEIVRRLDGLPLAIALCAPRFIALTPEQVLSRLDSLALERAGGRTRADSLEASVAASWQLLAPRERATMVTLSVFSGPFDLEGAEAGLGGDAAEAVAELVRRSLLVVEDGVQGRMFRMLHAVRAFARHRLAETEEAAPMVEALERAIVERAGMVLRAARVEGGLARLTSDLESIVDGVTAGRRAEELHVRAVLMLAKLHGVRGGHDRANALLSRGLERSGLSAANEARLRVERAQALSALMRPSDAVVEAEAARRIAAASGELRVSLAALVALSEQQARMGRVADARSTAAEAVELAATSGDPDAELDVISLRRSIEWRNGDLAACARAALEGLALAERTNRPLRACGFRILLGQIHVAQPAPDEAERWLKTAREDATRLGALSTLLAATTTLGLSLAMREDWSRARDTFVETADTAKREGITRVEIWASAYLGATDLLLGDRAAALERLEELTARTETREPLFLLIPMFAVAAGSALGRVVLDRSLETLRRAADGIPFMDDLEKVAAGVLASDAGAARDGAMALPPAFAPDLRVIARMLDDVPPPSAPGGPKLRVGPEGRWFSVDGAERVVLEASPNARRLLSRLADEHRRAPGRGLTVDALRDAAWPGDRSRRDVALNRVYVAMSRLRERGLRTVLVRSPAGWMFDPAVVLLDEA